jgi:hypothetical protein
MDGPPTYRSDYSADCMDFRSQYESIDVLDSVTSLPQRGDCLGVVGQDVTGISVGFQHRLLVTFKRPNGHYDRARVILTRKGFVRLAGHITPQTHRRCYARATLGCTRMSI